MGRERKILRGRHRDRAAVQKWDGHWMPVLLRRSAKSRKFGSFWTPSYAYLTRREAARWIASGGKP